MPVIQQYVPVLRWKQAERDALAKLDSDVRNKVTPLFELIMPAPRRDKGDYNKILADAKTVWETRLPSTIDEINKCCSSGAAFVDAHLVDGDMRAMTLSHILNSAATSHAKLVPVIHIIPVNSSQADLDTRKIAVNYAVSSKEGLCIRIDRFSLGDPELPAIIENFLRDNNLDIGNTDLLVDLGLVGEKDLSSSIAEQLSHLPELNKWRSFILAGGAFPKDLSEFERHSQNQVPRLDWSLWNDLHSEPALVRTPTYSDYTIQHPIYYGQMPGTNTSASIRYTDNNQWEVSRGEGLRNQNGAGHKQYPALAQLLVAQSFFKGEDFSFGDAYIAERAKPDNKNTGNPTTWLKAGINHHLTLVVQQTATNS